MNKKIIAILFGIAFLASLAFLFFNDDGYLRKMKIDAELDSLKNEIELSKKEIEKLKAEIDSLKTSPQKIERVAREKYNFKKPNETVIDIETQ